MLRKNCLISPDQNKKNEPLPNERQGATGIIRKRGYLRAFSGLTKPRAAELRQEFSRAPIGWTSLIVGASLVSGPLKHAFWREWAVAQCAVRPYRVVVDAPLLNQDLRFFQGVEEFTVEQLVAEPSVEALAVSVFPW